MKSILFLLAAQIALISARVTPDPRTIAEGLIISDRYVTPDAGGKLRATLTNHWNTHISVSSISTKSYDINNGRLLSETESTFANYNIAPRQRIFVCRNTKVHESPSNFPGKGQTFSVHNEWSATVNGRLVSGRSLNVKVEVCDFCYHRSPDTISRTYSVNGTTHLAGSTIHSCI
jgi:hypothetical protein